MVRISDEFFLQSPYRVRFEWGAEGVRRLAPVARVVVIVDILSFTTCVEVAVTRDCMVFPYPYKDETAIDFAHSLNALLAGKRGMTPSLSPGSLLSLPPHSRIVIPSPNGSTCTVIAKSWGAAIIAGCLRNASVVADFIKIQYPDEVISVIACGEHWPNGDLRPAVEDLIGAGAILSQFDESLLSPDARIAVSAFRHAERDVQAILMDCSSGRELAEQGFSEDVMRASELNVSATVPVLHDGAYVKART